MLQFVLTRCKPAKQWNATSVLNIAFLSQIFFISLQAFFSTLIPDHIPEGVFKRLVLNETKSPTDAAIETTLGSLVKWDAQYFVHIAQHGYTYENTVAFFPLFPFLVSFFAAAIRFLASSLNSTSCLILSAVLINIICFSLAALVLYKLALIVSKHNYDFAMHSVLFFVFNPARIFFIAPYSEALFSFTSFAGMLSLYDTFNFKSSVFFALSVASRSNGFLNIGFIIHKSLCEIYMTSIRRRKKVAFGSAVWSCICLFCSIGFILLPFCYHQKKSRSIFCDPPSFNISNVLISQAQRMGYVLPGQSKARYCDSYEFPYSYVQRHYWNVGFLKYFQWKQIPNFLLALPILCLVFHASYEYFIKLKKINLLINLKVLRTNYYHIGTVNENYLFGYYLHAYFLSLFCFLCIHVQVTTRMLASSTPLIYFIAAKYATELNVLRDYCASYFCIYCLTGILLFTNEYPWT